MKTVSLLPTCIVIARDHDLVMFLDKQTSQNESRAEQNLLHCHSMKESDIE